MDQSDTVVSIHPYLKIRDENLSAFKSLANDLIETTRGEIGCLYYGFSYTEGEAYCREGYKDAESLVAHLDNVGDLLERVKTIAEFFRIEVHGPKEEIAKLRECLPMQAINPKYYVYEAGFRH